MNSLTCQHVAGAMLACHGHAACNHDQPSCCCVIMSGMRLYSCWSMQGCLTAVGSGNACQRSVTLDGQDACPMCWEALACAPAIMLSCNHTCHLECAREHLRQVSACRPRLGKYSKLPLAFAKYMITVIRNRTIAIAKQPLPHISAVMLKGNPANCYSLSIMLNATAHQHLALRKTMMKLLKMVQFHRLICASPSHPFLLPQLVERHCFGKSSSARNFLTY